LEKYSWGAQPFNIKNKTTISKIYLKFQLLTIPPTGNYFPIYQLNPSTIFQRHFDVP